MNTHLSINILLLQQLVVLLSISTTQPFRPAAGQPSFITTSDYDMVHLHGNTVPTARIARIRLPGAAFDPSSRKPADPATIATDHASALAKWLYNAGDKVLCLTGAGLSTESGIPDYRGANGSYQKGHKPVLHDQFLRNHRARQRYWARSLVGWKTFAETEPNIGHYAITRLEAMDRIGVPISSGKSISVITQNVDALHTKAGTEHVTELHGRNDRVVCTNCGAYSSRHEYHHELERSNPDHPTTSTSTAELRPDGDADLSASDLSSFVVPSCASCGSGILKPDVVFFGDSVPRPRVDECYEAVRNADGLLCVGTSLEVHSAFRFVKAAAQRRIPVGILNVGPTRAEREGLFENDNDEKGLSMLTKMESPIGNTLHLCVEELMREGLQVGNVATI